MMHCGDLWRIDGVDCVASPPKLNFDYFPGATLKIQAEFYSQGTADALCIEDSLGLPRGLEYSPSDIEKINFAYKGNLRRFVTPQ